MLLRSALCLAFCLTLSLASAPFARPARAQVHEYDDAEARAAWEAGRAAYERGAFAEALAQFERAYALSPRPKLLFNIARAAESEGRRDRAIAAYQLYLERMQDAENREFASARLRKLLDDREMNGDRGHEAPPAPAALVQAGAALSAGWIRLYAGPYLGVGGSWRQKYDRVYETTTTDLKPTYGAQLGAELLLTRWLGVGAELRISSYDGEGWVSARDKLVELVVKPTGRYRVESLGLETYAGPSLGVNVPRLANAGDGDFSKSAGFTFGLLLGALYPVTSHLAVNLEAGFGWRWFSAYLLDDYEPEVSFTVKQGFLATNLVLLLGQPAR